MVTLKKLKELKQIKRDNKVIYNLLNTIIGECEQISKDPSCSQVMDVIHRLLVNVRWIELINLIP